MSAASQPKILITHPWMGHGGSEATAMWTLQALQEDAEITFVTPARPDFERWNATYGTAVDPARITFKGAPRLPGVRSAARWVHLQNSLFERCCRRLAPGFALCISAYNPVDFGKPGIQLIGDLSFSEKMRELLYPIEKIYHRRSLLRRIYLAAGNLLRGRSRPALAERGDLAVANSQWTAGILEEHFGIAGAPVLYPPVCLPRIAPAGNQTRNPLGFVWMGRISPEKKIEQMIGVLDRVREAGFPVTLQVAGRFGEDSYSRMIRSLIAANDDWISAAGFLDGAGKQSLLAACSFSLHCNEMEPFGIAVAEMAAAGCLPIVPETGGASEIVEHTALQFRSVAEAADKIVALLRDPDQAGRLRRQQAESVRRFSAETFARNLRTQVEKCLRLQATALEPAPAASSGTATPVSRSSRCISRA